MQRMPHFLGTKSELKTYSAAFVRYYVFSTHIIYIHIWGYLLLLNVLQCKCSYYIILFVFLPRTVPGGIRTYYMALHNCGASSSATNQNAATASVYMYIYSIFFHSCLCCKKKDRLCTINDWRLYIYNHLFVCF